MSHKKIPQRVTIKLEADSIIDDYVSVVQNSCNMLAFITSNLENVPFEEVPSPPVFGHINFNKIEYVEDKKLHLDMWLFNHGITDIIKALNLSMARANFLAEMGKIKEKPILVEEFQNFEWRTIKKFLKKDLPTLISLTSELVSEPLNYINEIKSINNARKCLEHRGGVVTKIDANAINNGSELLEIKWIGTDLIVSRNGERLIINEPGFSVKKGEEIKICHSSRNKSFNLGEKLRIDMRTFYELSFTGYLFIKQVTDNFNFGRK